MVWNGDALVTYHLLRGAVEVAFLVYPWDFDLHKLGYGAAISTVKPIHFELVYGIPISWISWEYFCVFFTIYKFI